VSSGLLLSDILPTIRNSDYRFAGVDHLGRSRAVVSGATLAPLRGISDQLDRISAGQFDMPAPEMKGFVAGTDELGQVSRKITQVGKQLRGVHEIFSTMRKHEIRHGRHGRRLAAVYARGSGRDGESCAEKNSWGLRQEPFWDAGGTKFSRRGIPCTIVLQVHGDEL